MTCFPGKNSFAAHCFAAHRWLIAMLHPAQSSLPESGIARRTLRAEATRPASHRRFEAMARRRFQSPTPFKEGNYWWLFVWDTNPAGIRKRQRIKLAKADMAVREVQKIADEKLRPMNQGLALTGSAMSFSDFMDQTPTFRPTCRCFRAARRILTAA